MMDEKVLDTEGLSVWLRAGRSMIPAVRDVALTVKRGGCTGVIGESGCGKSLTCQAVLGLLERKKWKVEGRVSLRGAPVPIQDDAAMDAFRGRRMALILQNPMSAFDTRLTIGAHFCEGRRRREWGVCLGEAAEMLGRMYIRDPEEVLRSYPFQLSGGMLQRVLIAMAITPRPELLIADEPTTALDCTTQSEILHLLRQLQSREGIAILLVSHDLKVISGMADDIYVMYGGQVVEHGAKDAVLSHPLHPYTRGLLQARLAFSKQRLEVMEGYPPRLGEAAGAGCPFAPRCSSALDRCVSVPQPLRELEPGHWSRCPLGGESFGFPAGSTGTA